MVKFTFFLKSMQNNWKHVWLSETRLWITQETKATWVIWLDMGALQSKNGEKKQKIASSSYIV